MCKGGLDENPPVIENFGSPTVRRSRTPPSPRKARRKFLGFLGNFLENFLYFREISGIFAIFREISLNLTGFSLI